MKKSKHARAFQSKWKKACAATLASGVLLGAISPTALAVDYSTDNGTVYVENTDGTIESWQDSGEWTNDNRYDHTANEDYTINISDDSADEAEQPEEAAPDTENQSSDNTAADENAGDTENTGRENDTTNVDEETEDTENTEGVPPTEENVLTQENASDGQIINVGDDVKGIEVNIDSVKIDGGTKAAVEIGDNTDIDLNLKNTEITNASNDGIAIGDGSNVDITFEGDNLFTGVGSDANTSGIQTSSSGEAGRTTVTVTGKGEDATFTVENASNGVYVGRNDSVTIDGGSPDGEGNLDIVIEDTVGTDKADSTISGRAIVNYGDLTITDGADVTIEGVSTGTASNAGYGIVTNVTDSTGDDSGLLEISGEGTNVTIKDTDATGILVESYKGTQAGELIIDGATVEVADNGGSGIWLDSSNATIQNGATVTIESASGHSINMGTITTASEEVVENTLEITGEGTEVSIKDGGNAGINASNYKTVNIDDNAKVSISKTKTDAVRVWKDASLIVQGAELDAADRSIMLYNPNLTEGMARMVVLNDAKVVVRDVYRYKGTSERVELIVLGGTLELTASGTNKTSGLTSSYYQTLPDSVQDGNTYLVWPTNGAVYGNEKLVNFQLPADEAHALFETFGWKDGKAVPYADGYSCDLSKYEEGEMLSVWVPAVILDYYYKEKLPEGTSFENMTEDEVLALLENTVFKGQDAIIRGQSISFATLDQTYTSNNTADTGKTWYYFDGEGNLQSFDADTKIVAQNLKNIYGLEVVKEKPDPDEPGTDDPAAPVTPIVKPEDPKAPVGTEELPAAQETPEASVEQASAEPQVKLPQTGQNWALAGLLSALGALLISAGIVSRKGKHEA